ncbi:hypothetical protein DFH08DRAFT_815902 [Mycena albidolilacea]|uniref:Uncharacterized protein n=1 Tax=Mycena albidolilacea TaxID=1033008 RepID=A0AAD7EK12_9AGAR|nr:hypothetical protein DFH08DRAFT_815902 [Mycena albidolilacea]
MRLLTLAAKWCYTLRFNTVNLTVPIHLIPALLRAQFTVQIEHISCVLEESDLEFHLHLRVILAVTRESRLDEIKSAGSLGTSWILENEWYTGATEGVAPLGSMHHDQRHAWRSHLARSGKFPLLFSGRPPQLAYWSIPMKTSGTLHSVLLHVGKLHSIVTVIVDEDDIQELVTTPAVYYKDIMFRDPAEFSIAISWYNPGPCPPLPWQEESLHLPGVFPNLTKIGPLLYCATRENTKKRPKTPGSRAYGRSGLSGAPDQLAVVELAELEAKKQRRVQDSTQNTTQNFNGFQVARHFPDEEKEKSEGSQSNYSSACKFVKVSIAKVNVQNCVLFSQKNEGATILGYIQAAEGVEGGNTMMVSHYGHRESFEEVVRG